VASVLDLVNRHEGEACAILGNGPSLTGSLGEVRELREQGYSVLGSNRLGLSGLVPDYLAIIDRLVAEDCRREIRNVEAKHIFLDSRMRDSYPKDEKYVWLDHDRMWTEQMHEPMPRFWRPGKERIYGGGTATYTLLQLAYLMGFQTVVLFGVDHHYVIPEGAILETGGIYTSHGPDPNHFDASYFGPGRRFHDPKPERMEIAYYVAERVFSAAGRLVLNATPGSALKVFPELVRP